MRSAGQIAAAWLVLAALVLVTALPHIDDLGMYYDEAFMAAQARDFVVPGSGGQHPGSVRSIEISGRPFPVRNAVYLGSLKSQLLIPALALFGASPDVVRITTLCTGLLALGLVMLFAGRVFGRGVALVCGALMASDPGFYMLSQFEWGPFTTNLLCRAAGLLGVAIAWQSPSRARAMLAASLGGLALGLGVFSRADFALIIAAAALGVALWHRERALSLLRERPAAAAAFGLTLFVGALPMLGSLAALLSSSGAIAERGGIAYKSNVLWTVLDGSHFLRLMEVGGRFDEIFAVAAPAGLFGWVVLAAAVYLGVEVARRGRRDPASTDADGGAFLLTSSLLLVLGMLAMPGAVRAHHQLNSMPFLQLLVATAVISVWQRPWPSPAAAKAARGLVVFCVGAVVVSNAMMIGQTQALMEASGGRGRWSREVHLVAETLDAEGGQVAVSLDWGFHEPLMFLTRNTRLVEPIWSIPQLLRSGRSWVFVGGAETLYLVHDAPYDLFGLGPDFLRAVKELGPDAATVTTHVSRDGEIAFLSVRIPRRHRIVFGGRFEIQ
jgi:hypothetical protein